MASPPILAPLSRGATAAILKQQYHAIILAAGRLVEPAGALTIGVENGFDRLDARGDGRHDGDEKRNLRQYADRLGRTDRDGRRRGVARRRVPSHRRRRLSGHSQLRAVRQGTGVPGRLQGQLDAARQSGARGVAGLEQQVSELGAGRSGEMGAGRLCLSARRFARRRTIARVPRRLVAARNAGSLSVRRMGGHAAVEQRQSRHQRHLLLRDESMDGRRTKAAASCRLVHLGRLVRLLPRTVPPRRHSQRFFQQLASAPGRQRAAWPRRARRQKRGDGRSGRRSGHAVRCGACRELRRLAGRSQAAQALRRLSCRAHRRFFADRGAATLGRQLGRHGAAHARQFRGLFVRRLQAEVARSARRHPFHPLLQQLRRNPAEALLRSFPQRRGYRLGAAAARDAQHSASRRKIRPARRDRMAAGAHAMDQIFSAAGRLR